MESLKPKVARISKWEGMTKLIYCCPCCGTDFAIYMNNEWYCHHCGQKIDWNDIPLDASREIAMKYHGSDYEGRKEIIERMNEWIESL